MAETQTVSSPVEVEDPFKGETPSLHEFNEYRETGKLPARFKAVSESAPDDTQEETEETDAEEHEPEPESDPDKQEPQPKSKRDKRIAQLLADKKELERKLAEKTDVKPESSTVKADPQYTRPKPTAEDKNADDTPKFNTYEEFVEELADWKAEQRMATEKRNQHEETAKAALQGKLDEARARYDDADAVIFPTNQAIQNAKIPAAVKEVFAQSDVFIDLCYVVGSDPAELEKFLSLAQTNPRAAIGKVFEYEREITAATATQRDDKGKFVAPEPKKTGAPKPPSPVSGATTRAFDVSDESLSTDEWARKRNKQLGLT